MRKYPRVLVIAHNPFSDKQNNGKTLSAFFKGWPIEKIAQLYLTYDKADFTVCNNFFRLTDLDVLKQFLHINNDGYKIINKDYITKDKDKERLHNNKLYTFIKKLFLKKIPMMNLIRSIIWEKVKPWENEKLKDWIRDFKPEIIFFQSSSVYAVFDMVEYLCNLTNATLYIETTDDYVTKHFSFDLFYNINIKRMIQRYGNIIKKSKCIFAIGDMMAEEYKIRFGGTYKVAMNSIKLQDKVIPYDKINNNTILLTYAGNLGLNRWKILKKIGKQLNELKRKYGINAKFEIYSLNMPSKKIQKALTNNNMEYKGSLNTEQLIEKRNHSDILVHVESFDRKNQYITRLSVSTKIPEYLLSERCILAVGPKNIASIKYIHENNIGKVITSLNSRKIQDELKEIILSREKREKYIINGKKIAMRNHSFEKNKEKIQKTLLDNYN